MSTLKETTIHKSPMSTYRCMLRPTWMISALQHKSKYKNQIFKFPCCSTREDLSIDVSITNVGLILTKPGRFLFSGCGQTDRRTDRRTDRQTDGQTDRRTDRQTDRQTDTVLESSHGNMSAHKKFQLKTQN